MPDESPAPLHSVAHDAAQRPRPPTRWPEERLLTLLGIEHPIIQAPMIGPKPDLAAAVSAAGGLGSVGAAAMTPDILRETVARLRARTNRPLNLNFFCHPSPAPDPAREASWRARLRPYAVELGLDPDAEATVATRAPFDEAACAVVEALRPAVVSFHFGLPERSLLERVRAAGARILSSATTVREARWLEAQGVDAIIAQGVEAGGHRGVFLHDDPIAAVATQTGTLALVPQVVDAVRVPVIAAGGIADGRGIAAAFALGACGVQIGTAFLRTPEAGVIPPHARALAEARDEDTALTNVFTGRPARGLLNRAMRELGPLSADAPAFPNAAGALQPLRAAAEARGSGDFTPLWAGQAAALARAMPAGDLVETLAAEAFAAFARLAPT